MINGVGQNAAAANLARAGAYPRVKLASTAGETSVQQTETLGSTNRKADTAVQVGFGDNTLSSMGAALRTIGKGLESARQTVPTLEQIQAQQRVEQAKDRLEMTQRTSAQQTAPQAENTSASMLVLTEAGKDAQTMQPGFQTTSPEKTSFASSTENENFALYSRSSETTQNYSTGAVMPKLDIKA